MIEEMLSPAKKHIAWCKERALVFVDKGDLTEAYSSMLSDLSKESCTHYAWEICKELGGSLLIIGNLDTADKMRKWIEGF